MEESVGGFVRGRVSERKGDVIVCVSESVCVGERVKEREYVCVRERVKERESMCVCLRERKRERKSDRK